MQALPFARLLCYESFRLGIRNQGRWLERLLREVPAPHRSPHVSPLAPFQTAYAREYVADCPVTMESLLLVRSWYAPPFKGHEALNEARRGERASRG